MPTPSRTLQHARWAAPGPSLGRRLLSVISGSLLLVIFLCAAAHGTTEETHGRSSAPAASAGAAADEEPPGPHPGHGHEECTTEAVVRTAIQAVEPPLVGAGIVAVLVVVTLAMLRPARGHENGRCRRTQTGRTALARTSRWRI